MTKFENVQKRKWETCASESCSRFFLIQLTILSGMDPLSEYYKCCRPFMADRREASATTPLPSPMATAVQWTSYTPSSI
jgi:hypothetical protein